MNLNILIEDGTYVIPKNPFIKISKGITITVKPKNKDKVIFDCSELARNKQGLILNIQEIFDFEDKEDGKKSLITGFHFNF